jgi:GTP-binding protein Era
MNERMVQRALQSLPESDAVLWVVDARRRLDAGDRAMAALLPGPPRGVIVAVNKIDGRPRTAVLPRIAELALLVPDRPIVPVSALTGENTEALLDVVSAALPEGPRFYPPDEITDEPERAIAAEMVREKVMMETREEIPYAVAVTVDAFEEKPEQNLVVIQATIHVARESQKPILIGQRGSRIKAIGQAARADIEALLGTRVFLELHVRVQADWTRQLARLREFGL